MHTLSEFWNLQLPLANGSRLATSYRAAREGGRRPSPLPIPSLPLHSWAETRDKTGIEWDAWRPRLASSTAYISSIVHAAVNCSGSNRIELFLARETFGISMSPPRAMFPHMQHSGESAAGKISINDGSWTPGAPAATGLGTNSIPMYLMYHHVRMYICTTYVFIHMRVDATTTSYSCQNLKVRKLPVLRFAFTAYVSLYIIYDISKTGKRGCTLPPPCFPLSRMADFYPTCLLLRFLICL